MIRSSLFWLSATRMLLTRRGSFVMQTGQTDCGVACALTVMNLMRRPADAVQAAEVMDADRSGSSLEDLRCYFCEDQGIEARALAVPAGQIRKVRGRAILHMRQGHYVVLLKASKLGFFVFDPAVGPVFYPQADFASLYSGKLLEVSRRRPRKTALPAHRRSETVGGTPRRGIEGLALFLTGFASRLLECALLLCLVAVLFFVLNQASFSSLTMIFGLIVVCGGVLLAARQFRANTEDGMIRGRQGRLWRDIIRTSLRGNDLNGFRGRAEKDVAASVRQSMIVAIPQRAQLPATLGAFLAVPALLTLLSPWLAGVHMLMYGAVLLVVQLDSVQVCRRSVRGTSGRYTRLGQNRVLLNLGAGPEMIGEMAKWTVIGVSGYAVLVGVLPPAAMMFWILTSMQIIPTDFRRAPALAPVFASGEGVSDLVGTEVPLRRQRLIGEADLRVTADGPVTRIEGLQTLTQSLQQPDLTVREQRLIMADVVRNAIGAVPDATHRYGPVRVFGTGADTTQADFETLMISHGQAGEANLPARADRRGIIEAGQDDPVLRALHSCEPQDFPVFWDFRERLAIKDLQARLNRTGVSRAGHLTMKRLTVIEAA